MKKRMTAEKSCDSKCRCQMCGGGIYGLGFIGAAIYYISTSTSFLMGCLGFLKALVWPVFLVYQILKFIGA